ncbi:MAG: alpha/beta hydrolase [Propionibacteriaceae bacterium]|jgi:pimeloyl-ACP methyl ester carboxylesterase|nr:alpha/beta hydrolase [Propionibacteriaceae bacterium]
MKDYPVHFAPLPNGETLAYRTSGAGPTVLLLHGNMSSSLHWATTIEALESSFTVYAPDLRGFGDSTYEATFDSLLDLAHDVEAFMDVVGIGKCAVAGWSTGGGVALELAADRPEQVTSVVLVDSVPPTGYPIFRKDALGQPIPGDLLKTKEEIAIDPVQVVPALTAYATGNREIMRAIWNAVIYNLHVPPADDYEKYLDAIMAQRNLVDVDYALLTFNMTDQPTGSAPGSGRLGLVTSPVTILHGVQDLVVPLAWGESSLSLLGDRATMVTFADSGHSPITDVPEEFFAALIEGLTKG